MRMNWRKWQTRCVMLSCGGVTLGVIQGLVMGKFASLFTQFLTQWLSILVALLFGGDLNTLLGTTA